MHPRHFAHLGHLAFLCSMWLSPLANAQTAVELETNLQKFSYTVGLRIGQSLRQQGIATIDTASIAAAISDVLGDRPPRLSREELESAGRPIRRR